MSKVEERVIAEIKAKKVIDSCLTNSHFNSARNYINLFQYRFHNMEAFSRLVLRWKARKNNLINNKK